jgi:tRNA dimethylallyltransferase
MGNGSTAAPPVIAVVGPTGSGKSDLAVALAHRLDAEIINADAMQFYRGMDIGTAKITLAERQGIPHHLLDILDVHQEASVSAFQQQARAAIADIHGRARRAILVGGSGLYVRAALDVIDFPGTDPGLRGQLEAQLDVQGLQAMRERLAAVDPISAARLGDARRVVRALEVHALTGRPFSSYMPDRRYWQPTVQIGLEVERDELKEHLALRVHRMVEQGLLDEVRRLEGHGLRDGKTAPRALGYSQFLQVLDGQLSIEGAVDETIVATRKFARRQLTWFRADPRIQWLPWKDELLVVKAVAEVAKLGK